MWRHTLVPLLLQGCLVTSSLTILVRHIVLSKCSDDIDHDNDGNGNGSDNMIYHITLPFALTISQYLIAIIQADELYNHVLEFRN